MRERATFPSDSKKMALMRKEAPTVLRKPMRDSVTMTLRGVNSPPVLTYVMKVIAMKRVRDTAKLYELIIVRMRPPILPK